VMNSTGQSTDEVGTRVLTDNARARQNINKENALLLAKAGVAVFPSSGKTPLIPMFNRLDAEISPEERKTAIERYREDHKGRSPIHIGATKNSEVVMRMFRAFRDAVPSIACGPSRLVVFDSDRKDEGPTKMAALWEANGGLPEGALASPTKSDGKHFIFADPKRSFTNKAGLLKKEYGTDVRGSGGQIVAPGSMLDDGRSYGTREDLFSFVRSYLQNKIPEPPAFITELIGATGGHNNDDITPSKERDVIRSLQEADWDIYEYDFDPVLGEYDIDQLKAKNAEFAKLYDQPSADCSTNRFLAARHVVREWPDMPAPALSIFFSQWEGAGEYTDEKPKTGQYDDRQIAREWIKNQGLSKPSNGDAFGPVTEDSQESEYEKLTTSNQRRKRIPIDVNLNDPQAMVDKVENVLLKEGAEIYRRGISLVEVVTDSPLPGLNSTMPTAQLRPVNAERLSQVTGSVIDFRKFDKRERTYRSCPPPRELMLHMMARGVGSKLRRISVLAATPMIRPDGSILATTGYDPATEVYLVQGFELPSISEWPTREQGLEALMFAGELFSECAFADKGPGYPFTSLGLSCALSIVVAGMARLLMSGIPMLTSTAATPGSGKSFIGTLIGIWLTGREIPVSNVAVGSAGELDKRLTAGLLGGAPMIHLDNCNGKLDSELLCQILTERSVAVRPLGVSEEIIVSGMPLVLANGNNVQVDENLARRTLLVELDARMEKPELRHFNLRPDRLLRENRAAYVAAILTALRAYLLALKRGEAKPITPAVGSFDGWSDYARSLMVWYGYRDPVEAMAIAQAEDPEKAARGAVFKGLHVLFGDRPFTASEVVQRVEAAEYDVLDERPAEAGVCAQVQENLRILLPKHNRALSTQSLGTLFRSWATKVEMGLTFKRLERNAANVTTYVIVPVA
jgi:Bifunctional DNA primase/polymerase, N-terminal